MLMLMLFLFLLLLFTVRIKVEPFVGSCCSSDCLFPVLNFEENCNNGNVNNEKRRDHPFFVLWSAVVAVGGGVVLNFGLILMIVIIIIIICIFFGFGFFF